MFTTQAAQAGSPLFSLWHPLISYLLAVHIIVKRVVLFAARLSCGVFSEHGSLPDVGFIFVQCSNRSLSIIIPFSCAKTKQICNSVFRILVNLPHGALSHLLPESVDWTSVTSPIVLGPIFVPMAASAESFHANQTSKHMHSLNLRLFQINLVTNC